MSTPTRMTNDISPVVHDSQSHYTLSAYTITQEPLQQITNSAFSTSKPNSMIDETSTIPQELSSAVNSDPPRATLTRTSPNESPATALETPERIVPNQSLKRLREEGDDEEDASSVSTKPAIEVKTKTEAAGQTSPTKSRPLNSIIAYDNGQHVDKHVEPRGPEGKSKTSPKFMPKNVVAKSGRGRACAACKRRKVKCKHGPAGKEADDEGNVSKQLSLPGGMDELEMASTSTEAEADDEPVTSKAPVSRLTLTNVDDANKHPATLERDVPKKTKAKKEATPKKAKAPPERTSTRNRKAPERFEKLQEQPLPKALPTKKGSSKVFDPVYITTNSTSRLGKADMYHMLTDDDTAWTSLSTEQQATLVAMLPDTTETQRLLAKIQAGETEDTRPQYLKASDVFRTEVAKFQADLTNGHLAKTWQAAAEQTVAERAAGEYDAWKAEEAELWWGQKSK